MTFTPKSGSKVTDFQPSSGALTEETADKKTALEATADFVVNNPVSKTLFKGVTGVLGPVLGTAELSTDLKKAKELDELNRKSGELARMARTETNQDRKEELLAESRQLATQATAISDEISRTTDRAKDLGRVGDRELEMSNLEFATRRGVAAAGEVGAYLAPGASELKAVSNAAKTARILQKMKAAGIVAAPSGALLAATRDSEKFDSDSFGEELAKRGGDAAIGAATSFLTAAAVAGAIEIGKEGLKAGGRVVKNFIPKKNAGRVYSNAFQVPRKIAERIKPVETGEELSELGITGSFDDLANQADEITGSTGTLTKINREALARTKTPIDAGEALEAARAAADDAVSIDTKQGNKIVAQITKYVKADPSLGVGESSAIDAFDAVQKLEKQGYFYMNKSTMLTPNPKYEEIGRVYLAAADALKTSIDKTQVDEAVLESLKTEAVRENLKNVSPKLAERFMNAKSMSDLRALQSPFVRLRQMIDVTDAYRATPFAQALAGNRGITARILDVASKTPNVTTAAGAALSKAGEKPVALQSLFEILTKASGAVPTAAGIGAEVAREEL